MRRHSSDEPVAGSDAPRISAVGPDGLTEAPGYPGIVREVAYATGRALQVRARAEGGVAPG